jgi:hypothetical protein
MSVTAPAKAGMHKATDSPSAGICTTRIAVLPLSGVHPPTSEPKVAGVVLTEMVNGSEA